MATAMRQRSGRSQPSAASTTALVLRQDVNRELFIPADWPAPTETPKQRVRRRAYDIYCARNGAPGDALSDWLSAEREILDAERENDRINSPVSVFSGPHRCP